MAYLKLWSLLGYNYFNIGKITNNVFKVTTNYSLIWFQITIWTYLYVEEEHSISVRLMADSSRAQLLSLKQGGNSIVTNWNPSETCEWWFQGFNRNQGNIRTQIYSICASVLNMYFDSSQLTPQQGRTVQWSMIPSWENSQCEA